MLFLINENLFDDYSKVNNQRDISVVAKTTSRLLCSVSLILKSSIIMYRVPINLR